MKIFIAGHNGMVGSALVRRLRNAELLDRLMAASQVSQERGSTEPRRMS